MTLKSHQDAFGRALLDHYAGKEAYEIIEREDGYIDVTGGSKPTDLHYLQQPDQLSAHDQAVLKYACGRVLDIGCGAGRHALALQTSGHDVVGVDNSPGAIEVARQRGVKDARAMSITQVSRRALGQFDTFVMMGNNFGLMGSIRRARWLLGRFAAMSGRGGRIIAQSLDVHQTDNAAHLAYLATNRQRGRLPGQIRMRVRYQQYGTPWFDYLMVSQDEMRTLLEGTSWTIRKILYEEGASYTALLDKR